MVTRTANAYYDALAAKHGWPVGQFRPQPSPYLFLQPTVPGFEYPRSDLPPQVHFIGPVLNDHLDVELPDWWSGVRASGRPVVLVTQGTIATDAEELVGAALAGLADEGVFAVAATGDPTASDLAWQLPANAYVEPFLPFTALMPNVAVFVTNGGYGGVTHAVAHGVPIVVAGVTQEKHEVANRVQFAGVGINLRTSTPSREQLRIAVRLVLSDGTYRHRAQELREECVRHNAPNEAATLIEQLAETRQPVYSLPVERLPAGLRPALARAPPYTYQV